MTVVAALENDLPDPSLFDAWLYAGQDGAWRIRAEASHLASVPRIDTADLLQRKARELRRPYLEWAAELARANDGVEWWGCELAARTSYTLFYDRVCALASALETTAARSDRTTLVVCPTPAFAETLGGAPAASASSRSSGVRALRAWVRLTPSSLLERPGKLSASTRLLLDSDPRYRRRILERHGAHELRPFAGALLFTWVDRRSFAADGTYADPHFGPLAEMLRGRGVDVAFVPRVLPGFSFADAVPRLLATGEAFLFPDAYLELDDHRDCARRAAAFAPAIDDDAAVEEVPLSLLAREHVELHRPSQAAALALEPLLRRFADAGVKPERIVHPCEGHGWELVLGWAARRHLPRTTVIGYDNLNMSTLALSMFSAPEELAIRPQPDRIVTNGPAYRGVLVREGLPESRVRSGCALRHAYLWNAAPYTPKRGRQLRVLAATELALGPSVELVDKAAAAFADDDAYDLVVKAHPLQPQAEIVRILGARAASLRFDERPTLELLAEADLLLYTYSAVGFEALALGVPPLFVRSETRLDLDQLEYASDLRWEARTPTELRAVAAEIATLPLDEWRAKARSAALAALAPASDSCVDAFL
ncbi:MAG TPA: hypothetical protein VFM96_00900 [Gaiellaceae bacterium]|nr:hypothetical protein [Gaiellaceae bacterium]